MNKVILIGRFTRDPEIRYSQGANPTAIARFNLAVPRRKSKSEEGPDCDFVSCVAFSKTADFVERFGRKGIKFVAEGRIQTGSYTNKDGQKVYTTDVVVESMEFAESKNSSGGQQNENLPPSCPGDGFMNIPDGIDEELPFN
jgi:single-strand DNA-binding protein